ncbi:MAG TPA: molybdopterin-dependent oxidoreductase [Candidatus Baltobacteraceae bacterium]|jgi:NADH-quinone oxidoreductase subunit G|nr:molybdopterin-dependent oxidoreductase [Candidatus Baltobacteraceae bacterium]
MPNETTTAQKPAPPAAETLKVKVDGREIDVPKMTPDWQGKLQQTSMLQACALAGIDVPHYCYHPKLAVVGNCRMCLVEFGTPAIGPDRKPVLNADGTPKIARSVLPYEPSTPRGAISCATPVSAGMEIYPGSAATKQMREAVLESLLINHPLDCPICDQAGECKLQEYSVDYGKSASRFAEEKVHKPKHVELGPRIVLDDERCILCSRCIRFTRDIAGDDALGFVDRGSHSTLTRYPGKMFDNNYTLNTVDICPVGALTSKDFRFQMRVWFLKETKSICTSCGTGCNIVMGSREDKVYRFEPRENNAVNSCWMCDHGRLNYKWINAPERLRLVEGSKVTVTDPLAAWPQSLAEITAILGRAPAGSVAIIASARQTNEELYLLKKLADKLGALTDSVPRSGQSDKLLLNADRNPNSTGAMLIGISAAPMGSNLPRIAGGIATGGIKTLIVFGEDVTNAGLDAHLLAKLDLLVVSDILPNKTTALAHYLLPGCAHAEKRGSFVNVKGRVQRFMQNIQPKGNARPEWEFLHELTQGVTGQNGYRSIEGLFNQMATEVPAFRGLTWAGLGDLGVTVAI